MSFDARPLDSGVGMEIVGLDLSRSLDAETKRALRRVWLDAGILIFRGLGSSAARQIELSRCFGELEVHPVESIRLAGHPEIIELTSTGDEEPIVHYIDDQPVAGRIPWHTDLIYTTRPCRGGLLRMVQKSEHGGQTGWIDTAAAYDALPEDTKERIEGLEARFDFVTDICDMRFGRPERMRHGSMGTRPYGEFQPVAHPLVWVHPETGRKALALSTVHLVEVVGMDRSEGDPLLEELVAHVTDGRFTYVHDWEIGDMALWDNWRTLHTALGVPPGEARLVHRTTLQGGRELGRLLEA